MGGGRLDREVIIINPFFALSPANATHNFKTSSLPITETGNEPVLKIASGCGKGETPVLPTNPPL